MHSARLCRRQVSVCERRKVVPGLPAAGRSRRRGRSLVLGRARNARKLACRPITGMQGGVSEQGVAACVGGPSLSAHGMARAAPGKATTGISPRTMFAVALRQTDMSRSLPSASLACIVPGPGALRTRQSQSQRTASEAEAEAPPRATHVIARGTSSTASSAPSPTFRATSTGLRRISPKPNGSALCAQKRGNAEACVGWEARSRGGTA